MRRMIRSGRLFVNTLSRRLIYWVVFGFLNIVESIVTFFARLYLSNARVTIRNGLYYVAKIALLVCCFLPDVDVSVRMFIHL